jgi:hypothetical protein
MNLCSPSTLNSTNNHQRKRKVQRTPSRSTSPSGHNNHLLPSQIRSLEIKVNSLQQSLSKLDEHTTTLINNQQAHNGPSYPFATDPPSSHPSPMESQFHLSPPYGRITNSTTFLCVTQQYVLSTYILLVNQSLTLRGLFPAVSLIHVSLSSSIATHIV